MSEIIDYWVIPALKRDDEPTVGIDDIVGRIEEITQMPLKTHKRTRLLCEGRQLAAFIIRTKYGLSLEEVGKRLGVDHSTVAYAVRTVGTFFRYDKKFVARWKGIIDYAEIDITVKPENEINEDIREIVESNTKLPTKCVECAAYQLKLRRCKIRNITAYDEKPISKKCLPFKPRRRQ